MAARKKGHCYVYVIKDGATPLYVGKGTGRRSSVSARKHGGEFEILEDGLTDSQAFKAEVKWIAELKPVNNVCAGGNGSRTRPRKKERLPLWFRKQIAEIEAVGSQKYCARFLLERLDESNCEQWGFSKVDISRLREVAHG